MPDTGRTERGKAVDRFATDVTPLVYDLQFRPDAPDVAFWVDWCREVGGPTLELGCGNGRVAIPLARAGLEVVGIDLWLPMLAAARERLAAEPRQVQRRLRLVQADMRDWHADREFTCAIIPALTFGLLVTREDQERTLATARNCLKEDGLLAFDVHVFRDEWLRPKAELPSKRRTSADGKVDFTEQRCFEFDPASRVITCTMTYAFHRPRRLGQVVERLRGRVWSRSEVEEVLDSAGFALGAVWGDYDRGPITDDSRQMIFVARRAT